VDRARLLRKKATEPERILWRRLRNRKFAGYKFRRQHPFDDYILDFYCPRAKLAIELDGGGHNPVVDVKLRKELRRIKVGDGPWGIAFAPK
jgi:very-short-patch-repair endonuclease